MSTKTASYIYTSLEKILNGELTKEIRSPPVAKQCRQETGERYHVC